VNLEEIFTRVRIEPEAGIADGEGGVEDGGGGRVPSRLNVHTHCDKNSDKNRDSKRKDMKNSKANMGKICW
jgi:hypothetical protein